MIDSSRRIEERRQRFLNGYKVCFGLVLKTDWAQGPADFDILEQVVPDRNRGAHARSSIDMSVTHGKDREKYLMPFFVSESEKRMLDAGAQQDVPWMSPSDHHARVTADRD